MNIIRKVCTNFWKGRFGYKPEAIVIHIMDGTLLGTDSWFANPASQVSAHYGIGQNGEVHQYVDELDSAWHAGIVVSPSWALLKPGINPNYYTIGIEHEGKPDSVWSDAMKASSAQLIKEVCARYGIPLDREHIIGHYQISAKKPNDPAVNKGIIDELIAMASSTPQPPQPGNKVGEAIALLEQALKILRG